MLAALLTLIPILAAQDLQLGYPTHLGGGQKPALHVTPARAVDILAIECVAGGETFDWERRNLAAGRQQVFEWRRDPTVTSAECTIQARFQDDTAEGLVAKLAYSYGDPLSVDISRASVDVKEKTLSVRVTAPVENAEIVAFGVGKEELSRQTASIGEGPGEITIPWVGDPKKVVLLDITLHGDSSWAGFTFSPWFLNIPHDDIHFETNSDVISSDQDWKMEATLKKLHEVVEMYGDLVPVKLYVAGCTDTVGDKAHNRDLSRRRAKALGRWLRQHGFTHPIHYHGFGEDLLAVPTADGVDNAANRRAIYIVSANPPPPGSGIPQVSWTAL